MAKACKETFMCEEPLAELISRVAYQIDRTKSDVIRACILLGIDTIRSTPSLTNRVTIEDRIDHQIPAR